MTGVLRVILVIIAVILEIFAIRKGSWLQYMGYMTVWTGICVSLVNDK